jgi:membrane-bound ClpP family serine protease
MVQYHLFLSEDPKMKKPEKPGNGKQRTRAVIKYVMVNLPAAVLVAAAMLYLEARKGLPVWLIWGVLVAWILKDVILFPFVRRAYEGGALEHQRFIEEIGTARERLAPEGYIQIHGELWHARVVSGKGVVEQEGSVIVKGIQGLTLLVEPEEQSS